MTNTEEAEKAIAALNGTQLGSRTINVDEARPKPNAERGAGSGQVLANRGARSGGRLVGG